MLRPPSEVGKWFKLFLYHANSPKGVSVWCNHSFTFCGHYRVSISKCLLFQLCAFSIHFLCSYIARIIMYQTNMFNTYFPHANFFYPSFLCIPPSAHLSCALSRATPTQSIFGIAVPLAVCGCVSLSFGSLADAPPPPCAESSATCKHSQSTRIRVHWGCRQFLCVFLILVLFWRRSCLPFLGTMEALEAFMRCPQWNVD